jgi:hypothetical protein
MGLPRCASFVTDIRSKSYMCGGQHGRCKCSTGEQGEELAGNGDLDVNTLVAAMEQADVERLDGRRDGGHAAC